MKSIFIFALLMIVTIVLYWFLTQDTKPESFQPMDKTKLYGSIFLDNLDTVIKNLTNPDIEYDTKRMQLFRYYDVLY
jgi:hypothetical protein